MMVINFSLLSLAGWLAEVVALLTSMAMLSDLFARYEFDGIRDFFNKIIFIIKSKDKKIMLNSFRMFLRTLCLILIMATSGVAVILPTHVDMEIYDVFLRIGFSLFLVLSTPCPWWRYVFIGHKSKKGAFYEEENSNNRWS